MSKLVSATQAYRINQINGASPLDLLIMAYDAALIGCGQRDLERTTRALSLLRNALDFSYDEEISLGFFKLYQYCADQARKGEYDEVANLLRELRDTWSQVREQLQEDHASLASTPMYGAQANQLATSTQVMLAG